MMHQRNSCLFGIVALLLSRDASGFVGWKAGEAALRRQTSSSGATSYSAFGPARSIARTRPRAASSSWTALSLWSRDDELEGSDRIKACVPYILPLVDGDHFGKYIYERIPPLGAIDDLLLAPLASIMYKIPFLSLGIFMLLTLGTRFNSENMNRNVRFSAQQAALIDLALIFPELIGSSFSEDPLPRSIVEPASNFIWYAYMSVIVYSIYCNLRGKKPDKIPYISNSADIMVGPF